MDDNRIRVLQSTSEKEAKENLEKIGVDSCGINEMLPKMFHLNIIIEGITSPVANIIKQEMLSVGADAAVSRGAVACSIPRTDVILMGTVKQLRRFAEKISSQPFNLPGISNKISEVLERTDHNRFFFKTSRREMVIGERTLIMGIINVTPDSFSDGGRFASSEMAVEEGLRMAQEGADLIDVGGESTRPGSDSVSEDEERRRVIPVIKALAKKVNLPISIDTMKAAVAREALSEGAEIVNDVSAMNFDSGMADVVADSGAAVVLMHMRGTPKVMQQGNLDYRSLRGEIIDYLRKQIERSVKHGIGHERIMVDPGIGFGKTAEDNMRIIRYLQEFQSLGKPVVIGASRKAFIGRITGGTPQERFEGTAAVVTAAVLNGVHVVRVHDVQKMKKVVDMADAVCRA